MAERCHNCGAELFAGQQFCRRCGAPVRREAGEAPTQLFAPGAPTAAAQGTTSGLGGAGTDAVGQPYPTAYQPPLASYQQTSPLVGTPPPRRRRGRALWFIAAFAVVLAVAVAGLAFMLFHASRSQPTVIVKKGGNPRARFPAPPAPPDLHERVKDAIAGAGLPLPLDESGATVTGDETVLMKTYEIDDGATFSVQNANGGVTVTGWDEPMAEVKVRKRGGSAGERSKVPVLLAKNDEGLTLVNPAGGRLRVDLEIRLPRNLSQIEISSERGDVKVAQLDGTVVVDAKSGELEFRDVAGTVRSKVIKGNTKVVYQRPSNEGAQEFTANRGNVEVTFAGEANTDLKAEVIDGDISVDDRLGLKVEKRPAGQHVVGRLGDGSEPLLIKVVNGDIKLKK